MAERWAASATFSAHGQCTPTPDQQEAIAVLSNQDVDNVLAYLRFARSLNAASACEAHGHGLLEGGLSVEQIHAIETLSGCTDRKLRNWLTDARKFGTLRDCVCHDVVMLRKLCRWSRALQKLPKQHPFDCGRTTRRDRTLSHKLRSSTAKHKWDWHQATSSIPLHGLQGTTVLQE